MSVTTIKLNVDILFNVKLNTKNKPSQLTRLVKLFKRAKARKNHVNIIVGYDLLERGKYASLHQLFTPGSGVTVLHEGPEGALSCPIRRFKK